MKKLLLLVSASLFLIVTSAWGEGHRHDHAAKYEHDAGEKHNHQGHKDETHEEHALDKHVKHAPNDHKHTRHES